MSRIPKAHVETGLKHLQEADPVLAQVIQRAGPFGLKLERDRFRMLARAIVGQQISGKAAASIWKRLEELVVPEKLTAENLSKLKPAKLKKAGLSPQKLSYMQDLSQRVLAGEVRLHKLARMSDDEVIAELIQVKGIGVWTAQMCLMFSLGRLDVLPHDDLGIRAAIRNLYGLTELPDKQTSHRIAEPWRPYATIASWYCWRSLEFKPA